jgi:hypothetical protein
MDNKDDDYVRPPMESKTMRLVDGANDDLENNMDFLEYKFRLTQDKDPSLTHEIKTAMINSKRDEMVRQRNIGKSSRTGGSNEFSGFGGATNYTDMYTNSVFDNGFTNDVDDVDDLDMIGVPYSSNSSNQVVSSNASATNTGKKRELGNNLMELILSNYDSFNEYCGVETLHICVAQYSEGQSDNIVLQYDICWGIHCCIDAYCVDSVEKEQMKSLFVPDSQENYDSFLALIESEKILHEEREMERLNKQIHENELVEQQKKLEEGEKLRRTQLTDILKAQLSRLSGFDPKINILKTWVFPKIEEFTNLDIDAIQTDYNDHINIIQFIDQVRIDAKKKEELKQVFISDDDL